MSIQDAALIVGICVGIVTLIKIALDIAANPRHRDTTLVLFLICLTVAFELLPMALVFIAFFLPLSAWSSGIIFLGLIFAVLKYARGTGDPQRGETAYLVLFVGFSFFAALALMSGTLGEPAPAPDRIEAPKD